MRKPFFTACMLGCALLLFRCNKKDNGGIQLIEPAISNRLNYGDSVFYLSNSDYAIGPVNNLKAGSFSVFPDNLTIDKTTGAITITQKATDGESQTGMWYKVRYKAADGSQTDSASFLISGLTYVDKFYNLAQDDSIIYPIYNGDVSKTVPQGNYDLTSDNKFAISSINGQINIKECLRRGFFNSGVMGTGWKTATVKYSINDNSQQATNKIDLVIYYYHTMNDVPSNVSTVMQAHQQQTLGLRNLPFIPSTTGAIETNLPSDLSLAKPRPPCVIIVGN